MNRSWTRWWTFIVFRSQPMFMNKVRIHEQNRFMNFHLLLKNIHEPFMNTFINVHSSWTVHVHLTGSMLRPLSCLTMFCNHNFSLICRFNLKFSQNYMNIDTDEIQHWFCYFVQPMWNEKTIWAVERSHILPFSSPYKILFFSVPYCFVYNYVKHIQPVYTWMYTHQFEH